MDLPLDHKTSKSERKYSKSPFEAILLNSKGCRGRRVQGFPRSDG